MVGGDCWLSAFQGWIVGSRSQSGLPAWCSQRTRLCRKFTSPNATRLMRFVVRGTQLTLLYAGQPDWTLLTPNSH